MPADEPDPPRKFYDFKPREFERVNPPAQVVPAVPSPIRGTRPVATNQPITVEDILREANAKAAKDPANPAAPKNDVHGHLQTNLEAANAAGLNDLKPLVIRPSRRKRDYWTLVGGGNLVFATIALVGHDSPIVFVCSVSGAAMFTVGVTWIMWFLMDRY